MNFLEVIKSINIPDKIKNSVITALATGIGRAITEIITIPENEVKNWKEIRNAEKEEKIKLTHTSGEIASDYLSKHPELAARALDNLGQKLIRSQKNKESIALKMLDEIKLIDKNVEVKDEINEDWLFRFWSEVENISDFDLQSIIAKILAEEIIKPGTIGMSTVQSLLGMSKKDISSFQKFCSLSIIFSDSTFVITEKMAFQEYGSLEEFNVNFGELLDFETLGLIRSVSLLPLSFISENDYENVTYSNRNIKLNVKSGFNAFYLTPAGKDLRRNLILKENNLYTEKLKIMLKDDIIL